jgi:hypothetical protein
VRKSRFGGQQIVPALQQVEHDVPVTNLCGKPGISERIGPGWLAESRRFAGSN